MQHYQVIQINTKRERENWKKENLIALYIHTFCSPFKKAYFRDLEKESRWKRVNGRYVCQMSPCNLTGFSIRPYEGTFYVHRFISVHIFRCLFGQHTSSCFLPRQTTTTKKQCQLKDWSLCLPVNAKVSPPHVFLPSAWARPHGQAVLHHGCQSKLLVTPKRTTLPTTLAKMLLIILMSVQNEQFSAPWATWCTN